MSPSGGQPSESRKEESSTNAGGHGISAVAPTGIKREGETPAEPSLLQELRQEPRPPI